MRSSDVWLGIPYDVFSFTQIQNCFAGALGVNRGWLSLRMGSSHLYDRDRAKADEALRDKYPATLTTPNLPGFPPAWLEDVLIDPERHRNSPSWNDGLGSPWSRYAQVLASKTSLDAREVLVA